MEQRPGEGWERYREEAEEDRSSSVPVPVARTSAPTPTHLDLAAQWYAQAARSKHPLATLRLGMLYARPDSQASNLRRSLFWLLKATALRSPNAYFHVGRVFIAMSVEPAYQSHRHALQALGLHYWVCGVHAGETRSAYELAVTLLTGSLLGLRPVHVLANRPALTCQGSPGTTCHSVTATALTTVTSQLQPAMRIRTDPYCALLLLRRAAESQESAASLMAQLFTYGYPSAAIRPRASLAYVWWRQAARLNPARSVRYSLLAANAASRARRSPPPSSQSLPLPGATDAATNAMYNLPLLENPVVFAHAA